MAQYPMCEEVKQVGRQSSCDLEVLGMKRLELEKLERIAANAIKDAEASHSSHEFWRRATIAAGLVSVSCDVIISIFASPMGGAGYEQAKTMAKALNGDFTAKDAWKKIADTHVLIGTSLLESQGKKTSAKVAGGIWTLGFAVKDLVELERTTRAGSGAGILASITTAKRVLRNIQAKLHDLRLIIDECAPVEERMSLML